MKAIIKFDLNADDEMEQYKLMMNAINMSQAIWDIKQLLRNWDKYGVPIGHGLAEDADREEVVSTLRRLVGEILEEYNVRD